MAAEKSKPSQELGSEERPLVVKPEKPFEKPVDLVKWESHARAFRPRSSVWFLGLLVLGLLSILLLALLQQWMLILVVLSVVFVLSAMNMVEPGMREYTVTTAGIRMGSKLFGYEDLKWFWFEDEEGAPTLYVATYLGFPHILEVTLPQGQRDQLTEEIERHLLKYLPYHEEKHRNAVSWIERAVVQISPWLPQSLVDWYSRRVKFLG